mmetsp:Transcript_14855/g.36909  ORF Transcript_14855/g.36909 Transcript_14855/m.36909 type:complete len:280 (+) Transcript_14855:817-1656(+)
MCSDYVTRQKFIAVQVGPSCARLRDARAQGSVSTPKSTAEAVAYALGVLSHIARRWQQPNDAVPTGWKPALVVSAPCCWHKSLLWFRRFPLAHAFRRRFHVAHNVRQMLLHDLPRHDLSAPPLDDALWHRRLRQCRALSPRKLAAKHPDAVLSRDLGDVLVATACEKPIQQGERGSNLPSRPIVPRVARVSACRAHLVRSKVRGELNGDDTWPDANEVEGRQHPEVLPIHVHGQKIYLGWHAVCCQHVVDIIGRDESLAQAGAAGVRGGEQLFDVRKAM